jgi:predicted membrane protein
MKKLIKVIITFLLLICLLKMPYGYYQFVRFAAMVGFAYLAFSANEQNKKNEVVIYIGLALLFQPFIKIALGRTIWNIIDLVVGVSLLLSIAFHKNIKKLQMKNNKANENLMESDIEKQTEIKPTITSKNKWLYPTDEFGIMEKGVEFESKTYVYDKKENDNNNFTII